MRITCGSCHSQYKLDRNRLRPTGSLVRCSKCGKVFKAYPVLSSNRRKHKRIKTQNLISYFSFDDKGKLISHGLGIALDVSRGGILLETPNPVKSGLLLLTATDKEKNFIEVKSKLIYSKKTSLGTYLCGIEFMGINERITNFITKLVKEYNFRGHNLYIALKKRLTG
jgi:predicted Zn finger-like uncharacterized protein